MAKNRIKVPRNVDGEVMFKSDGKCYCGKRGDNIHHIDGNPANNDFDNLVLLCYDHHHDVSVENGLKKKLSPTQIKRRRNLLYIQNEKRQRIELKHYSSTLQKVTGENLYRAALDAAIVIELIKLKDEYFNEDDWSKQSEILRKVKIYNEYSSIRISDEVVDFLDEIADGTRSGMSADISDSIFSMIYHFFPQPENAKERKLTIGIAERWAQLAFAMSYDSFIYLGNLAVASSGLEILMYLYSKGKSENLPEVSKIALNQLGELERTLQRPERNDLENAKRLLKIFRDDIGSRRMRIYEKMPEDLDRLIDKHRLDSRFRKL